MNRERTHGRVLPPPAHLLSYSPPSSTPLGSPPRSGRPSAGPEESGDGEGKRTPRGTTNESDDRWPLLSSLVTFSPLTLVPYPPPLAPQAGREPRSALPSGSRLRPVCDARIGGIGEVNGESKMKVDRSEDMRRLTEAMR